jgi:hypothetical protein
MASGAQAHVFWNLGQFAGFRDRGIQDWVMIPVDDQALIALLLHQRGVERFRQDATKPCDPDIPRDVAYILGFRNAEPAERMRR